MRFAVADTGVSGTAFGFVADGVAFRAHVEADVAAAFYGAIEEARRIVPASA